MIFRRVFTKFELMNTDSATFQLYIHRDYALREIRDGIEKNNRLIVVGSAGVGKTSAIINYADNYPAVEVITGGFAEYGNELNLALSNLVKHDRSLLIIDSFEDIRNPDAAQDLLEIFSQPGRWGMDMIIASRNTEGLQPFQQYASTFVLNTFTDTEMDQALDLHMPGDRLSPREYDIVKSIVKRFDNNPSVIGDFIRLFQIYSDTEKDVFGPLMAGIKYKNELLAQEGQIIHTPPQNDKKIISDIKAIEKDLIKLIKKNPRDIYTLTPREFEKFIAELYSKNGYNVVLTKETRDGGKDFIITNKSVLGNQLVYGQCKQKRSDKPVGISVIKELHSTVVMEKATAGIVVTSSYFSADATKFANEIRHTMSLVDFVKLNKMIESIS